MLVLKDFSTSILAVPLSDTATSVVVGDAGRFPSLSAGSYFYAVLQKFSDRHQVEIVKVIGVSGNTFALERAQAGTVAKQFMAGDYIELRLTVATFDEYIRQCVAGKVDSVGGVVHQTLSFENAGDGVRSSFGVRFSDHHETVIGGATGLNAVSPSLHLRPLGKDNKSVEATYTSDGVFSLFGGAATVAARKLVLSSPDSVGWPNGAAASADNYARQWRSVVQANNSSLYLVGDGTLNARRFGFQVGNADPALAHEVGVLELNPYGGDVRVNGGVVYHTNYRPTPAAIGAVPERAWAGVVKLGSWSAVCRLYNYGELTGKMFITVGSTRGNFVCNATFLVSCGHAGHGTITQLESHGYSQIVVRLSMVGDAANFEILDEDFGSTPVGTDVSYFIKVHGLFGQLDQYTVFTPSVGSPKEQICTVYKSIKIGNDRVYTQGFKPTPSEIGAFPLSGGKLNGPVHCKQYVIAESLNGLNWTAIGATNDSLPYISANVNGAEKKVLEFNGNGETLVASNIRVNGAVHAAAWGTAFEAVGGKLRSDNPAFLSLDGNTYSFVTSIGDAHLCQNSYWNGSTWLKYDPAQASGHLVVSGGQLRFRRSDVGSFDPLQYDDLVYHTGHKPSPADIGAANANDVYHKNSTYSRQEIDLLGRLHINDARGAIQTPSAFASNSLVPWFSERNGPTGGWYSGINMRGWSDIYAGWQLVSGSDLPDLQAADVEKTALWFRTGSGEAWGEYQKVYTTKHKPTPAEIGAIPTNTANGTPVAAYYTDAAMDNTGTKIRLPFNAAQSKMVSFTVRVYQDYQSHDIQFSGYLYDVVNNWYAPKAIMIAGSAPVLYAMGRDDDGRAYVWIGGNSYRGVGVFDVVGGYNQADWNTGWEISVSDHKPNLAMEGAVYPPYSPANKPNAHEIGAAPDGFGVGGYCADIGTVLGDCNLRRQGGFFQGSNIEGMPTEGHALKYVINLAHANSAGYFGYIAMDFDLNHAWLGGQAGGLQKQKKFVFQFDRITAAGATGSDYNNSSIEVIGSGGGIKPTIGFHQPSEFAGSIALWGAGDFRFHTQGFADYAGIMVGLANVSDVYIRSDVRLKTNFVEMRGALDKLSLLQAYYYDKKGMLSSEDYSTHELGLKAQDVEAVEPVAVRRVEDSSGGEILSISGSAINAMLVQAINELRLRVEELERYVRS